MLDFVGIEHGEEASASVAGAVAIAQAVEAAGYRRYWVSEHHNMTSLACSAPELLTAHVGAHTSRIRVGAAGIMLPNHAPLKVAETFRTLLAMYPGRIDLALGRAPGTDPLTAHVLRRGMVTDPAAEFPGQVAELLAFLGDGFPAGHPYAPLVAAPVISEQPELFVLGSSPYGPRFAAVNGMSAAFAHHMSPDLAFEALRGYRRDFAPRTEGATPYSAMSVLAFASDDNEAILDFEAAWTLTIQNLRRGIREPLRPEQVRDFARSRGLPRQPARRRPDGDRGAQGRGRTAPRDEAARPGRRDRRGHPQPGPAAPDRQLCRAGRRVAQRSLTRPIRPRAATSLKPGLLSVRSPRLRSGSRCAAPLP